MERLTVPDEPIEGGMRRALIIDGRAVREQAMTIYWRLKKYEDTGLTPEEIMDGRILTGWIPIEERLPQENDGRVIVCNENGKVSTGRYSEYSNTWYIGDMCGVGGPSIVAWMPLPEPYRPSN